MCGRFVSATPPDQVAAYFGAELSPELRHELLVAGPADDPDGPGGGWTPNFNVAPTDGVEAVRVVDGRRRLEVLHWGLVPFWADDPSIGSRMVNARAETVADKRAFAGALERRRCIVAADGYYEWKVLGTTAPGPRGGKGKVVKQPFYIHRADGEPLAFAGLWERWRERGTDRELWSCTIVTTAANAAMAEVHDRMPAILPAAAWDRWLDPEVRDVAEVCRLLGPAPDGLLTMHAVGTDVNSVRNQGPGLIDPVEPARWPLPGEVGVPAAGEQGTLC